MVIILELAMKRMDKSMRIPCTTIETSWARVIGTLALRKD